MKRCNYVNVVTERDIAADGVQVYDLGVNPLSVLLLNLRPLNESSTLTNFANAYAICSSLLSINIMWRGSSVFQMSGADAYALAVLRHQFGFLEANGSDTDNDRRCVTLPIVMGRFPFDASCCFPRTQRGEFTIELNFDVAATGYDNYRFSVDAIEMPDAQPSEFERRVTISRTFSATGWDNVPLPIGNDLRGILMFGTTAYTGGSPAPTIDSAVLTVDNEQFGLLGLDWEVMKTLQNLRGTAALQMGQNEFSRIITASAGQATSANIRPGQRLANHVYHRFDVTEDDEYSVPTLGRNAVNLRVNAGVANAARFIPVERVRV